MATYRESIVNTYTLSQQMLEDALESGSITLGNGIMLTLTASQVLSIARYVLASKVLQPVEMPDVQPPSEMGP